MDSDSSLDNNSPKPSARTESAAFNQRKEKDPIDIKAQTIMKRKLFLNLDSSTEQASIIKKKSKTKKKK